jgi:glycerol-3-phosphate acyltransferase PlsY
MLPAFDSPLTYLILTGFLSYLLGSVPFGVLVTRMMGLGDVRKIGSGNIGATNVLRTGSKPAALATVLLDAGKGLLAVVLGRTLAGEDAAQIAALMAFLGHLYPVWLGFKGGKGVATLLGALVGLAPVLGLIALLAWLFNFFIHRYSSLSALVSALFTPLAAYLMDFRQMLALLMVMAALLFWKHRENIKRLIAGTEPETKFSSK